MLIPEILMIEDRKDDRDLFAAAVAANKLRVRVAFAADAVETVVRLNRLGALSGSPLPALIILDLGLPGLKGQTLLQVIRTAYGPREVAIVVLTGSQDPADRAICAGWDISDYKVKTADYDDLVAWVKSLERFLPSEVPTHDIRRRLASSSENPPAEV